MARVNAIQRFRRRHRRGIEIIQIALIASVVAVSLTIIRESVFPTPTRPEPGTAVQRVVIAASDHFVRGNETGP